MSTIVGNSPTVVPSSVGSTAAPSQAPQTNALDPAKLFKSFNEALGGLVVLALGARMLQAAAARGSTASSVVGAPPSQAAGGLQVGNVPGFPANAVRTQGGYTVVAEGKDQAWKIYGPGQNACDEALTRVWGDPHVSEKDGTKWDFTKDSSFMLPDGTRIFADTTAQTGQSVTQGLTIVSGNDRVDVTGVNTGSPKVTAAKDGQAWLGQNAATVNAGATFSLQSDGNNVDWFRSTNGKLDGLITGAKGNVDGKGSYDQIIDSKRSPMAAAALAGQQQVQGQAPQPQQNGSIDLQRSLAMFGMMALGGMGFLGNADIISSFMNNLSKAVSELSAQGALSSLFNGNAARAGVRV